MTQPVLEEPVVDAQDSEGGRALIERIKLLSALAVAAVVFWYVGWWAAAPIDPDGPVSLLMVDQGVVTMAELLGLAVVVSSLAVAICGAGSAERGPLAVAVGLAAMALRGGEMDRLVLFRLTATDARPTALDAYPVWSLIAETWLWLALIGAGLVVGRWVEGWFEQGREDSTGLQSVGGRLERRGGGAPGSDIRQAIGSIAVSFFIAWGLLTFTTGSEALPVLKGQIYFALIVSFLIAALIAHGFFQSAARVWLLIAIAFVAMVAYAYGRPDDATLETARRLGTYVTLRPIARPLPIEFAALGAIGVLFEADAMAFLYAMFGLRPDHRSGA